MQSQRPRDVGFADAVADPDTRAEFIRRKCLKSSQVGETNILYPLDLQVLLALAKLFMKAIVDSTSRMPYGMRFMAREILSALKVGQMSS
jgi:Ras GTPase-activating-like protein IQGAP2/3